MYIEYINLSIVYHKNELYLFFRLAVHVVSHKLTEVAPETYDLSQHLCATCGKRFRSRSNLVLHERIHSGDRRHACATCGRRFVQRGALVAHARAHAGQRPHACHSCGRRFSSRGNLRSHELHRHVRPPPHLTCSLCPRTFRTKSNWRRHARLHETRGHVAQPKDATSAHR